VTWSSVARCDLRNRRGVIALTTLALVRGRLLDEVRYGLRLGLDVSLECAT